MSKTTKQDTRKLQALPVQMKYTMLMTLSAGVMGLIMIFVMAFFIQRNYTIFMGDELGVSAQVVEIVRSEQRTLEITLFFLFITSVLITFGFSFFVTRRLVGPMVALQRHLWLFTQGDYSHDFRLRKNDEFKELEILVNELRKTQLNRSA